MKFIRPADLTVLTVAAIRDLRAAASAEYVELTAFAQTNLDTLTDETLDDIEALRAFDTDAQAEIDARTNRAARLAAATAQPEPVEEPEPVAESEPAAVVASVVPAPVVEPVIVPSISDIAGGSLPSQVGGTIANPVYASLVAAADVPGFSSSQVLDSIDEVAQAFMARTAGYHGMGPNAQGSHGVAVLRRNYPTELQVFGTEADQEVLNAVRSEARLPGGSLAAANKIKPGESLTAAAGWCAPSTTIYDTCLQITTDGLADFPEVQAPRGGIRHNTGIEFSTIFGNGTGYFNLTEAQVIAGSPAKTCLEIPCPSFTDDRLGVTGLCLTGNILQNRGYPEFVATFIRGALAASAHQKNMLQIAAVVTGSTAVDLTAAFPWTGDGSVVSQVLSAVDMAITDIKYRLRLQRSATVEIKMPFWVMAQMRADWIRRNAADDPNMLDSMISDWFATRSASVDFVYDWQDAFSAAGVGLGANTPVSALPTQVVFLAYPAGTWVRAVSDVITLNAVYDSTKLVLNQLTQLFTEDGWKMIQMCPISRAYTVNICPSGETGGQRTSTNALAC